MPADFLACVRKGGKVRTKKLSGGRYIHLCKDPDDGKWYAGEVKKKLPAAKAKRVRNALR